MNALTAIALAQSRYDHALPVDAYDALDTDSGQDWLYDQAQSLLGGDTVAGVDFERLADAVFARIQSSAMDWARAKIVLTELLIRNASDARSILGNPKTGPSDGSPILGMALNLLMHDRAKTAAECERHLQSE